MSKVISFNYGGKDYKLEYNRDAIRAIEREGFSFSEQFGKKPFTETEILFRNAFLMHHSGIKSSTVNEIFNAFPRKTELIEALYTMALETANSIFEEPAEGKNLNWTIQ